MYGRTVFCISEKSCSVVRVPVLSCSKFQVTLVVEGSRVQWEMGIGNSNSTSLAQVARGCYATSSCCRSLSMYFRLILLSVLWCSAQSLNVPRGVYIHIPFCRRRCHYCNFPVVVVGERPSSQQQQGEIYTALLLREIKTTFADANESLAALETVYFGGGTPSLLPVECTSKTHTYIMLD